MDKEASGKRSKTILNSTLKANKTTAKNSPKNRTFKSPSKESLIRNKAAADSLINVNPYIENEIRRSREKAADNIAFSKLPLLPNAKIKNKSHRPKVNMTVGAQN